LSFTLASLPCLGVVVSLVSPYGVNVSLLNRCILAFELITIFGSSLPPVVCRRAHVLLCCLCLFADSGVQHFASTFLVTYCDIRYDFRIRTRFGSSLPLVVWLKAGVVFVICVCLCIVVSNTS